MVFPVIWLIICVAYGVSDHNPSTAINFTATISDIGTAIFLDCLCIIAARTADQNFSYQKCYHPGFQVSASSL